MHHPTDRIAHTAAFVTPVVEQWLEREIARWVHPMKDRSDDPSHHERTLLPRSYIPLHKGNDDDYDDDDKKKIMTIMIIIIIIMIGIMTIMMKTMIIIIMILQMFLMMMTMTMVQLIGVLVDSIDDDRFISLPNKPYIYMKDSALDTLIFRVPSSTKNKVSTVLEIVFVMKIQ